MNAQGMLLAGLLVVSACTGTNVAGEHGPDGQPPAPAVQPTATPTATPVPHCDVLAVGDSLTAATGPTASWRAAVDTEGWTWIGPNTSGGGNHAAHNGWTTSQLAATLDDWAAGYDPDLVYVLAGSNDVRRGTPPADVADAVTTIVTAFPDAHVIVGTPPTRYDRPDDTGDLDTVRAFVALGALRSGATVRWVDLDAAETHDGVHPIDTGAARIAAALVNPADCA